MSLWHALAKSCNAFGTKPAMHSKPHVVMTPKPAVLESSPFVDSQGLYCLLHGRHRLCPVSKLIGSPFGTCGSSRRIGSSLGISLGRMPKRSFSVPTTSLAVGWAKAISGQQANTGKMPPECLCLSFDQATSCPWKASRKVSAPRDGSCQAGKDLCERGRFQDSSMILSMLLSD